MAKLWRNVWGGIPLLIVDYSDDDIVDDEMGFYSAAVFYPRKTRGKVKLREPNSEAREAIYMCSHCDVPICNCPTEECGCYKGEYCSKCEHNPK
jgi:hypothetical protein